VIGYESSRLWMDLIFSVINVFIAGSPKLLTGGRPYCGGGTSWAQRNPTLGSCSVGSALVRKDDRNR
jgi:hypothetical protein